LKERMNYNEPCRDHLGKEYANYREMAEAYGLTRQQLIQRLYAGRTLEEALTMPRSGNGMVVACTDHLGKEHHSFAAMAKAYGLSSAMVSRRLNRYGWDLERALTTPAEKEPNAKMVRCRDHLGNEYPSLTAMSEAYQIPYEVFRRRQTAGWDTERILTTPAVKRPAVYVDHKGNEYPRKQDLAKAYGLSATTLTNRLNDGWELEEALTTPARGRWG